MKTLLFLSIVILATALPSKQPRKGANIPKLRIMGGSDVSGHEIPYQTFIELYNSTDGDGWYCGGSIISKNYVLSSASCCKNAEEATMTFGARNVLKIEDTQEIYVSDEIKIHENYVEGEFDNDLALIKLPESLQFTDAIQAAALPSSSDAGKNYVGALATASGWGIKQTGGLISPILSFVDLDVVEWDVCEKSLGKLPSTALCTSGKDKTGPCKGDTGGPLTVNYVLVGVITGQTDNCKAGQPSAYTNVASFLDWIQKNSDVEIH